MSFVLHHMTKPFVFGISNIINNYKYSMDTLIVLMELNFHHLMVVDICVLDHMIKQFVYGMLKHQNHYMFSMDMKIVNNNNDNNNDNKMNNIGVIGGNGYTICSGSEDKTIRIWDIETTKQLSIFKGHESWISSVKYGSNELLNTILSEVSVCGIFDLVNKFKCSMDIQILLDDNTIRFWNIRSNKKKLYVIERCDNEDDGILCLKFVSLKKKVNDNEQKSKDYCGVHLYYGSRNGQICVWG
ncbi:beta subunit of coatomer complex [Reticulomyxa filosa]|uniref:Beta subunit of coatomer complex n=1 Tax=Reticulomyxa filosa TaxID=46433 RepID=X6LTY5_RETFI|nr:beta subunit of coatomer complex [Reticulomyxa filosa]|eukprot:ETO04831.1 beta subunit of coatomer complex [Reticulomyxa filosa]